MVNAAEYLIGFFEAGTTDEADRQGYRFPDVVQALSEVESAIDSWESMGGDVDLMRSCLERWKKSALNTFMDIDELRWDMSMFTHAKTQEKLTDGDLMGLQSVAEKLSASTVSYSEDARQKMRNMIEEAVKCVRADDSLPSDLLAYLSRLIREAREALDEYELTGDFKLSVAFDRLCNALRVAETKTKKHPVWEKFNEQFMVPLIAQVGVNAAVYGLTVAQVLPAIGS